MAARRIGVLTGGGDCPGLNAVIRAVTKTLMHEEGAELIGFLDGYEGLVLDRTVPLGWEAVSNILTLGGTILGTSNTANPVKWAEKKDGRIVTSDRTADAVATFQRHGLEGLVVIGGDGTMCIAGALAAKGIPILGVPKTIDNDVVGTELTFGFQSAVNVATDALDRLHSTASAHHRVMLAEVMGRYAGWIALHAGIGSGSDVILIPEIPFKWDAVVETCRERQRKGRRFSILCVAEGAKPEGGQPIVSRTVEGSPDPVRLGGVGRFVADTVEQATGVEARATILGYVQRGGTPCAFDRVFATSLGWHAAALAHEGRWGRMVAWQKGRLTDIGIAETACGCRTIPLDHPLLAVARAVGTCLGE